MQASQAATADGIAGQITEQAFGIPVRHETEPCRIFQIDDEVAGVIRHLDQEGQRVTPPGRAGQALDQAGGAGDAGEVLGILLEEAEFLAALAAEFVIDMRWARVFGEGCQYRAGQLQTARVGRALQAADDTEALRIALVTLEIGPLCRGESMALEQAGIAEPLADGILAGMAEGRIADVVRQAGGGDDGAEIARFDILQPMPGDDLAADDSPQRTADATRLQAVRQAGTHVVALGKRENLRLVLHAAESRGEDDAVVVLLECRPFGRVRCLAGAQPFVGKQFLPDFAFAHALRFRGCDGPRVYSASRAARI